MTFTVSYYCPHCETMVELERDEYLADKAVTPYPFEGWTYADPDEDFESAEGVGFVCGESDAVGLTWKRNPWTEGDSDGDATDSGTGDTCSGGDDTDTDAVGCGQSFYLSFVKFADGEELDPRKPAEYVTLSEGRSTKTPRGPWF